MKQWWRGRLVCCLCSFLFVLAGCGPSPIADLEVSEADIREALVAGEDQRIRVIGSSTVAPFAIAVAERFGAVTEHPTPLVEATGTGGGFKTFCQALGPEQASLATASRPMRPSEHALCASNGIRDVSEILIGHDGIVIANAVDAPFFDLTEAQVFLALAKQVPDAKGAMIANPYKVWSDIDAALPDLPIAMLGPPPTSGTRDAFIELAMTPGARANAHMAALEQQDSDAFLSIVSTLRSDGAWVDLGENDTALIQALVRAPDVLGVVGFSHLSQNADRIKGARLSGMDASYDAIASGEYGLSRTMYLYVKKQNLNLVPGIADYVEIFTADAGVSRKGFLGERGLIPLSGALKDKQRAEVVALRTYEGH